MNTATLLTETAHRQPGADALIRDARRITYAELERAAARVADGLGAAGIRPGDRVGMMLPNAPELVAAYHGTLRAGAVVVPLDPDLKRDEVRFSLADAGARLLIAWRGLARPRDATPTWAVAPGSFFDDGAASTARAPVVERHPDDTAVIAYTSGTTGRPRGAELTHTNVVSNARATAELFGLQPDDAVLAALPLTHAFGQTCTMNASLAAGARIVLSPRLEPLPGVTVLVGGPSMYARLLAAGPPGRSPALRLCICGGAPLAPEVLDACEAALGGRLLEGYGLTETSPVASFNRSDHPRRPGSVGTPIDGVEMRLRDVSPHGVGELEIRGPNVMKGYWNRPEETRAVLSEDGWLRTGDLARVDADGAFAIVGRAKDLVIRDGRNVHPREIEDVLQGHPDVLEAAVLGIPDALLGEDLVACVVLRPRASVTEDELRDYVRERVADFKCPRRVWFAAGLPRTRSGKLLKRAIVIPREIATHHAVAA
ncbi:MAG TPA: AMP-binding protein [Solirubrobacteraceae bacterium]|nr:AMP-binding protein [Solirubrobacteraceae bacterium]